MRKTAGSKKVLVVHGPNLHLLGKRQTAIYGKTALTDINRALTAAAKKYGLKLEIFQSNSEGAIVDKVTSSDADILIINPAAYTHTSIAIRDAILGIDLPAIEVHLSNIHAREDFRKRSLISDIALGVICGLGPLGYSLAMEAAANQLKTAR